MPHQSQLESVATVARCFGLRLESVRAVSGGFSGALIFQVRSADGCDLAVRRISAAVCEPDPNTRQLHRLLARVHASGVPEVTVPIGLPTSAVGETIAIVSGGCWQVEPWKPGIPIIQASLSPEQMGNAAELLHRFYTASASFAEHEPPNGRFRTIVGRSPAVARRLAVAQRLHSHWLSAFGQSASTDPEAEFRLPAVTMLDVIRHRLPQLRQRLQRIEKNNYRLQPVIRDLWAAHILFTGRAVTGLIDLNASATDHVSGDIVRLARSWFGADNHAVQSLISAFRSLHRLDEEELELLKIMDESNVILSPATWLRRRYLERRIAETQRPEVIRRFGRLVEIASGFVPL